MQIFDVHVAPDPAIVDAGFLAGIPKLQESIVTFSVAQFQSEREAGAFIEVPVIASGRVLQPAARPVSGMRSDLHPGQVVCKRRGRSDQGRSENG